MSEQSPVADMINRIKTGQAASLHSVQAPYSRFKERILVILQQQGYISSFSVSSDAAKPHFTIVLKYYKGKAVISSIRCISLPSRRVYKGSDALPTVMDGLGVAIVSTSRGVMTAAQARESGQGGEIICEVS